MLLNGRLTTDEFHSLLLLFWLYLFFRALLWIVSALFYFSILTRSLRSFLRIIRSFDTIIPWTIPILLGALWATLQNAIGSRLIFVKNHVGSESIASLGHALLYLFVLITVLHVWLTSEFSILIGQSSATRTFLLIAHLDRSKIITYSYI